MYFSKLFNFFLQLNLKKCENTIIGGENLKKGISGGEKRRLAFASEVLTNPLILFCDEPTSGLDSFMAISVVECMKNLAKKGKTIICTIHQPSSEIFELFDKLCLLAEGRLAFIGSLKNALIFFEKYLKSCHIQFLFIKCFSFYQIFNSIFSQGYRCPQNYNPADFYIQILAISPSDRENCLKRQKHLCDAFGKSRNKKIMMEEIDILNNKQCSHNLEVINFNNEIR